MKSYANIHWDYFLLLERDLSDIFDYIEPCPENLKTYGPMLTKLLLSAGSEIEATFKDLIKVKDPDNAILQKKPSNMNQYRQFAHAFLQKELDQVQIGFNRSEMACSPWDYWWKQDGKNREPEDSAATWWTAYTDIKHNRAENSNSASMENVLDAMAALFSLIGSLARAEQLYDGYRAPTVIHYCDREYGRVWWGQTCGSAIIMNGEPNFRFEPIED